MCLGLGDECGGLSHSEVLRFPAKYGFQGVCGIMPIQRWLYADGPWAAHGADRFHSLSRSIDRNAEFECECHWTRHDAFAVAAQFPDAADRKHAERAALSHG